MALLCPCRRTRRSSENSLSSSGSKESLHSGERIHKQPSQVEDMVFLEVESDTEHDCRVHNRCKANGELSDRALQEIRATFELCDADGSGEIHAKELHTVMRNLGFKVSYEEVDRMIAQADNGSGAINFEKFSRMVMRKMMERKPRVENAFQQFDPDGFGFITLQKLKRVARALGEDLRDDELQDMLNLADKDKDGLVTQQDFMSFMKECGMW
ncbi:unnamed protein product [Durusdinium trenchii]|uniref:EF-hand domain-containing protein n=1 Tax=Durusdinium trenchii TaxID=1381693 RepID=A0ABP0PJN4_9DINO